MNVAIGVLTFRRPERLRQLIPQLIDQIEQVHDAYGPEEYDCVVVVVDNDPSASAHEVAATYAGGRVSYHVEARAGISAARNRVLDETRSMDLLVFIDDDETPHDLWLVKLLETHDVWNADLVAGPVVSQADGVMSPFVTAGAFLDRSHRAGLRTGDPILRAATNNLLLDLRKVRAAELRFDDRFGLGGGEDSMFTGSLARAGARLVWCAEAVVTDHVPPDRLTARYVVGRAYSMSNAAALVELGLCRSRRETWTRRLAMTGRETTRLILGVALLARGLLTWSLPHRAKGLHSLARAFGVLAGVVGHRALAYRRS